MGQYRMPAEWERHEATWLAWPHEKTDWPGKFAPVPWVFGEMVRHLARAEVVRILISGEPAEKAARRVLRNAGADLANVEFWHHPTDRCWTRDFCPIFVRDAEGEVAMTHWRFNGWAKYDNHRLDAAIPARLRRRLRLPYLKPLSGKRHIVLEGGSIDVNGQGALLTTEECLLSPIQARNPGMAREEIEALFASYLGADRVIWLKNGIVGDDTHGHVDDLARFVSPDTVVIASEPDRGDENHSILEENYRLLKQTGLRVVRLPMPRPVWFAGQRLPASYANFYIANGMVLVPVFNDPADREALNTLAKCFPGREVIGIYCRDMVLGLGTLHCATQQQPAVSKAS